MVEGGVALSTAAYGMATRRHAILREAAFFFSAGCTVTGLGRVGFAFWAWRCRVPFLAQFGGPRPLYVIGNREVYIKSGVWGNYFSFALLFSGLL